MGYIMVTFKKFGDSVVSNNSKTGAVAMGPVTEGNLILVDRSHLEAEKGAIRGTIKKRNEFIKIHREANKEHRAVITLINGVLFLAKNVTRAFLTKDSKAVWLSAQTDIRKGDIVSLRENMKALRALLPTIAKVPKDYVPNADEYESCKLILRGHEVLETILADRIAQAEKATADASATAEAKKVETAETVTA